MKKTKTIEIEYEWFEPGTMVMFKVGSDRVHEVESCEEPDGSKEARCVLKGHGGAVFHTSKLKEVTVVESSVRENESDELKPCPFCGSIDIECKCSTNRIHCECYVCSACSKDCESIELARRAWNCRVKY